MFLLFSYSYRYSGKTSKTFTKEKERSAKQILSNNEMLQTCKNVGSSFCGGAEPFRIRKSSTWRLKSYNFIEKFRIWFASHVREVIFYLWFFLVFNTLQESEYPDAFWRSGSLYWFWNNGTVNEKQRCSHRKVKM